MRGRVLAARGAARELTDRSSRRRAPSGEAVVAAAVAHPRRPAVIPEPKLDDADRMRRRGRGRARLRARCSRPRISISGWATTQSIGSCGSTAVRSDGSSASRPARAGGAEASTDQTSWIDWFQNSSDQNAVGVPERLADEHRPRAAGRLVDPVGRRRQDASAATSPRTSSTRSRPTISPVRFQPTIASAGARPRRSRRRARAHRDAGRHRAARTARPTDEDPEQRGA